MPPHPIKALLFDLDDTLWPLLPLLTNAEATLYDWLAIHLPGIPQRFTNVELRALRNTLLPTEPKFQFDLWALRHATLRHACHLTGENKDLVDEAMAVFSAARNAVAPFEDVVPALTRLNERFIVGSISNGFADLQAIGMSHHFRCSLAAHQFGCAKPDPAIFLAACDALRIEPHETVYVGDDPMVDVKGAQDAGLLAVWMNRFERPLPPDVVPDAICTSLYELESWLTSRTEG